jgi:putative ABC transport system permease protein
MTYLQHSLRRLIRARAFTITVLLTLGLGIGANTAIFSAIHTLLLKPLHYPEPDRLVALQLTKQDKSRLDLSLVTIMDWRSQTKTLQTTAGAIMRSFGLTAAGSSVSVVLAGMVTSDFPIALGIQPALGRFFSEEEELRNTPVAILTDTLWRNRFAADPAVLGRRLELNEQPRTIIGVLPPVFDFPIAGQIPDLLIPISHVDYGRGRGAGYLQTIGRLRRGATLQDAQSELEGATGQLARTYPEYRELGVAVEPLDEALRGRNRQPLLLLAGAGLLLLLIACANVTSLLLAQLLARSREVAIRVSLGAGVSHLARQFLVDGVTLSALGATAGLLFAELFQSGLPVALHYSGVRNPGPIRLEFPALLFALVTLIVTALIFALVPTLLAWKQNTRPHATRSRLRSVLVVAQVALSMTLLLSAGLLLRSFFRLMSVDPGFRTNQVFTFGIGIPESRYDTERKMIAFHQKLIRKLEEIPGVEVAAQSGRLPLRGSVGTDFEFESAPIERTHRPRVSVNPLSPGYFRALSIPLISGRDFSEYDVADKPRVAMVNEAFIRTYSPHANPIGKRIRTGFENGELNPGGAVSEIVGIAGDVRQFSLEIAPKPQVYLCALQYGLEGGTYVLRAGQLYGRPATPRRDRDSASEPRLVARQSWSGPTEAALCAAVQAAVASVDPRLQRIHVYPMSDTVRNNLGDRRVAVLLLGILSLAALGLTAVGIYGVISFLATQRMREMAIRAALGAQRWQVAGLIVRQGLVLAVAGVSIGALASVWTGSLLRAQLYETSGFDPLTLCAAAALLLVAALLACGTPAFRAASTPVSRLLTASE